MRPHQPSSPAPISPRVRSLSTRWTETKSLALEQLLLGAASTTPASAARSLGEVLAPGHHVHAEGLADPGDLAADLARGRAGRGGGRADRRRRWTARGRRRAGPWLSATMPRARPRISAQVSSTGGSEVLAVPQTVTPCRAAASRSMDGVAHAGGDRAASAAAGGRTATRGRASRSRIVTTISQSPTASASSSSVVKWLVQRPDFDVVGEGGPVGHGQRDVLVVVEHGTAQLHGSGAYMDLVGDPAAERAALRGVPSGAAAHASAGVQRADLPGLRRPRSSRVPAAGQRGTHPACPRGEFAVRGRGPLQPPPQAVRTPGAARRGGGAGPRRVGVPGRRGCPGPAPGAGRGAPGGRGCTVHGRV